MLCFKSHYPVIFWGSKIEYCRWKMYQIMLQQFPSPAQKRKRKLHGKNGNGKNGDGEANNGDVITSSIV